MSEKSFGGQRSSKLDTANKAVLKLSAEYSKLKERNSSLVEGIRKLADELHERASREYCSYVEQMRREECLGWEAKIEAGQFGDKELAGHTYAGTLLGRHRALAKVAEEVLALVPPAQEEKERG